MQNIITKIAFFFIILNLTISSENLNLTIQRCYSVFSGVSIPFGDFANTHETSYVGAYAQYGFAGALEAAYYLNKSSHFGMQTTVSLIINPFDNKRLLTNLRTTIPDSGLSYHGWRAMKNYLNIPIMTGFVVRLFAYDELINIRAFGQAGLNILRFYPYYYKFVMRSQENDYTVKMKFRGFALAYGAGVTVTIGNRLSISGRYLNLGEPEGKLKMEMAGSASEGAYKTNLSNKISMPVSVFVALIGLDF